MINNHMNKAIYILILLLAISCHPTKEVDLKLDLRKEKEAETSIVLLGTIQDAGSPHAGCKKACCAELFDHPDPQRMVVSLGVYDEDSGNKYLFEATPDLPRQMKYLKSFGKESTLETPDGIFLTHAHIGHYAGLMYLGKEAMDAQEVPVYAMPRMKSYLETNGPWSQLVKRKNISLISIENNTKVNLTPQLIVEPVLVPHRDEYSETVGYYIYGPNKTALFIPDIDKWDKWESNIIDEIAKVDYAFLDATFFSGEELGHRDMSEIPHPFIMESMELFKNLPQSEKDKIIFIHFNHTNPVLNRDSKAYNVVVDAGFKIGQIHDVFSL